MAHKQRGQISFVQPGSLSKQDDYNDSSIGKTMGSMMMSIHSEYSDLEDDDTNMDRDDDDITQENKVDSMFLSPAHPCDSEQGYSEHSDDSSNNQQSDQPSDDHTISTKYAKYGIGALLMKKMGYEEGKGIGIKQSGILDPLGANPNMGRLGVGGKKDRHSKKEGATGSSPYNNRRRISRNNGRFSNEFDDRPSELQSLTSQIYKLVLDFVNLGVDVSFSLKDWARSLRFTATEDDIDSLRYEHGHLEDIWRNIFQLNTEERLLEGELGQLDEENSIEDHYEELLSFAKQWEEISTNEPGDERVEQTLKDLSKLSLSDDDIVESMAVTILQSKLQSLASIPLDNYDDQKEVVVPTLNKYTELLNPEYNISAKFYAYLFDSFRSSFDRLLEHKSISCDGETATDEILTTVASIWLDSGCANLKNCVFNRIVKSVIIPHFDAKVDSWDLLTDETLSEKSLDLLEIILVAGDDDYSTSEAVYHLESKVESYFTFGVTGSVWYSLDDVAGFQSAKLQISYIMHRLVPVIESLYESTTEMRFQTIFKTSLASWIQSLSFIDVTPSTFDTILYLSTFLDPTTRFTILQFLAFNSWIVTMIRVYRRDPQAVPSWYAQWYQYFNTKLMEDITKDLEDLIRWYLNKALDIIRSNFDSAVCQDIPKLDDEIFPKADKLFQPVKVQSGHSLQMTFRDVVIEYCMENKIALTQLSRSSRQVTGLPLFRLNKGCITRYGYVDADVLWISHSDSTETNDYEPILLDTLVEHFLK
ncbi:hypothetical protein CANMA_005467 [Candida margitis]|uniref:uncharacterized protein n=1 Tax=Candida margitis TaxID=1775924 RepID=UPI0022280C8D|nr:uncharacterized protein CANMA_005467 [Candida margitis]KAI5949660.1 hypothetical protein CANMA_005467 [Candida margitis]